MVPRISRQARALRCQQDSSQYFSLRTSNLKRGGALSKPIVGLRQRCNSHRTIRSDTMPDSNPTKLKTTTSSKRHLQYHVYLTVLDIPYEDCNHPRLADRKSVV